MRTLQFSVETLLSFFREHIIGTMQQLKETLGTRVKIEPKKAGGGCVTIDFFSADDIKNFLELINKNQNSVKEEVKEEIQNEAIENFSI